MTMTINGSGTITGLSAGGLPDATIQQADLATGVAGNGPTFSAYVNPTQSISVNTYTKVQFNTEEWDTASAYDNTTNYRFQPNVAGYYQVNTSVYASGTAMTSGVCRLYKNGATYRQGTLSAANGGANLGMSVSSIVYLNGSTDYVEVYGYIGASSAATFVGGSGATDASWFTAALVRAA